MEPIDNRLKEIFELSVKYPREIGYFRTSSGVEINNYPDGRFFINHPDNTKEEGKYESLEQNYEPYRTISHPDGSVTKGRNLHESSTLFADGSRMDFKYSNYYHSSYQVWRNSSGQLHRDNDLPAVIYEHRREFWKNGLMHREHGPAVEELISCGPKRWGNFQFWRNGMTINPQFINHCAASPTSLGLRP